jgi:hypothetical protein
MSRIAFEVQFELATLDKTTRAASIYAMHPIPVVYDFFVGANPNCSSYRV